MIDLHLHLLPGVDDGPADLDAALALARECCARGPSVVVATPHFDEWTRAALPDAAAARDRVALLQHALDEAAIPLHVLVGGETYLTPDLPRQVRDGLVPTIAGASWLLVEAPVHQKPIYLEHVFFELQTMGITPLLAHPERYSWLHDNPGALGELVRKGVRAQVTASSLTGGRGPRHVLAQAFVRRGFVQVIATDRHKAGAGTSLGDAYEAAVALVGTERARQLVETHPRLIVAGEQIAVTLEDEIETGRSGWIERWLRR